MHSTVSDIMTHDVVTVGPDTTVDRMRHLFDAEGFHHLVVVEKQCPLGVVSDRDLLRHLSPWAGTMGSTRSDEATLRKRAHQVMSRTLVSLSKDAPVLEAIRTMLGERVSCLPILDEHEKCVGIVTWRDVLRWTAERIEESDARRDAA